MPFRAVCSENDCTRAKGGFDTCSCGSRQSSVWIPSRERDAGRVSPCSVLLSAVDDDDDDYNDDD